jgi:hypothetical protein
MFPLFFFSVLEIFFHIRNSILFFLFFGVAVFLGLNFVVYFVCLGQGIMPCQEKKKVIELMLGLSQLN